MNAEMLIREWRAAGIAPGDSVILHSSLRTLGYVDGGAQAVVDSLVDAVGVEGHVLVPTFTYSLPNWNTPPFHFYNSKSRVGSISEALRLDPRAERSFHPTHSVAVIGPQAEDIVRNHLVHTPLGAGSPFHRMIQRGARIVMLGTQLDTCSSLHVAEVMAPVPYLNVGFNNELDYEIAWFANENDETEFVQLREIPGCSRGFRTMEEQLFDSGALKRVRIGPSECLMADGQTLLDRATQILRTDPTLLLCYTSTCSICPKRRRYVESLSSSMQTSRPS